MRSSPPAAAAPASSHPAVNATEELPLVSVVTVVRNGEKFLEQAIRSVIEQTYPRVEYLVVDGGSTDGTLDIIQRYQAHLAYWVSEPDGGIYDAWNKALRVAKGEWIAFLGSDDLLLPRAIADYVDYLRKYADTPFEYLSSRVEMVTEDLQLKRTWGSAWDWQTFRHHMNVAHVGSLHHRNLFVKYGHYDTGYRVAADYELLLRAGDQLRAGFLNEVTARMRAGGASLRHPRVLYETLRAKVHTAGRSRLACTGEFLVARLKFGVRRALRPFFHRL